MDGTVKVWRVPPAVQPRRLVGRPGGVRAIAWGDEPDTLRAFDAKEGLISLWDVVTGLRRGQTAVPAGSFGQFSNGGTLLAVATAGETPPRLLVCDAGTGQPVQTVPALIPTAASFSPDASLLAVGRGGDLEIADLRRSEVGFRWKGERVLAVSWSPNGRHLAIAGRGDPTDDGNPRHAGWVHVFDPETRERTWKLRHGTSRVEATAVTWSPDGRRLVSGDGNGLAEVWELSTGRKTVSAHLHTARINALAWSPDGRRIASGSADKTVRVWDPDRGEELLKFDVPDAAPALLQWSPDGRRLAAAGPDGTIQIWDASAGYRFVQSESYAQEQARVEKNAAVELWNRGQQAQVLGLLAQTLEKQKTTLGPEHDDTLETMRDLAAGYQMAGRLPEAVALHEKVLEIVSAKHGPDHSDTLIGAVTDLAWLYTQGGRLDRAESLFTQALEVQRRSRGEEHPETLRARQDLAFLAAERGQWERSVEQYGSILDVQRRVLGESHRDTLLSMNNLAYALARQGQLDRAEALFVTTLELERRALGREDGQTLQTMANLGEVYQKQGRLDRAETMLRECLALRQKLQPNSFSLASTQAPLGRVLALQQKYAEAELLLLAAYQGLTAHATTTPGWGKHYRPDTAGWLAELYEAWGKQDQAAAWRQKLSLVKSATPADATKD
jgi:tetratricopeptide (TPR) repeat protein